MKPASLVRTVRAVARLAEVWQSVWLGIAAERWLLPRLLLRCHLRILLLGLPSAVRALRASTSSERQSDGGGNCKECMETGHLRFYCEGKSVRRGAARVEREGEPAEPVPLCPHHTTPEGTLLFVALHVFQGFTHACQ